MYEGRLCTSWFEKHEKAENYFPIFHKTQCINLQGANNRNEHGQKILASKIPGAQRTIYCHKTAFMLFIESPADKVINQSSKQRR